MAAPATRTFVAASLLLCGALGAIVNTEVKRTIDATGYMVRVAVDATFEASGGGADQYEIAVPAAQADNLAFVGAVMDEAELAVGAPSAGPEGFVTYAVALGKKASAGTVEIDMVFTRALQPHPSRISQHDNQLVVLEDSHVWPSPYETQQQSTTVKLGTSTVEEWTKRKPSSLKGSSLKLGPYKDVAALDTSELRVHFENNSPFAHVTRATKEVEVSHWGNVAVEEMYDLQHAGAVLDGSFSRLDYQMRRQATGPSFRMLKALLPEDARDVYYRDQIGNISSSSLRHDGDEGQLLELQARFPLFGGWKTSWYMGFNVPSQSMLEREGDRMTLTADFGVSLDEVPVDDFTLKVVLPERAKNVRVNDAPAGVAQDSSLRHTYLDAVHGRPVVVLHKDNLVPDHSVPFTVSYDFPASGMMHEPMLLSMAWFAFYVLCMVGVRVQLSLSPEAEAAAAEKPKTE